MSMLPAHQTIQFASSRLTPAAHLCLQATHSGEGVTNAGMAARPGLEVFTKALELVQQRTVNSKQWLQVGLMAGARGRAEGW